MFKVEMLPALKLTEALPQKLAARFGDSPTQRSEYNTAPWQWTPVTRSIAKEQLCFRAECLQWLDELLTV